MYPPEWKLSTNKGQVTLQGQRLTLFQQCKIVECISFDHQKYLLFFYKDHFLSVQPLVEFEQDSFLGLAERKGCHFPAPNPLLSHLLPTSTLLKIVPLTQLQSKIAKKFPPEESGLILSYFDSYISAEKLEEFLKNVFFTYRRNGKMIAAYRFAKMLVSRGYKRDWIVSTIKHSDYANASTSYLAPLSELLETNPMYVEQKCYLQSPINHHLLLPLYSQQNRSTDLVLIQTDFWLQQQDATAYSEFIHMLATHLSENEVLNYLRALLPHSDPKSGLHHDVYRRLILKSDYENATTLLFSFSFPLTDTETDQLPIIFEHVNLSSLDLSLEIISERLFPLVIKQPSMLETILNTVIPELLNHHSLTALHVWLKPVQIQKELPIIKKIDAMVELLNDSDQQFDLGVHYYDLKQYDQAIECFSWEMEINPTQIEPIQWLAKTYRHLGKLDEVQTYHTLLSQIQRSS